MESFDAIILGGGKGGKTLATDLGHQGVRVALIEADPGMIGGSCINLACIPTKAFIASARAARAARSAVELGVNATSVAVNWLAVRQRVERLVVSMRTMNLENFRSAPGLELILGRGSFHGPHTVEVTLPSGTRRLLTASRIFINTGARPAWPDLPGLASLGGRALTSTTAQRLEALPEHLIVLGGGYVALEFAQMFRDLGSRVTLVMRSALLPHEDVEVVQVLQRLLDADGIEVLSGRTITRLSREHVGVSVELRSETAAETRTGSHVLVALGRVPMTEDLNLTAAGVATDAKGFVQVNDRLETTAPGVWALGDVNGGPQFTHVSLDDYRIVKANVYGGESRSRRDRIYSRTAFTEPELARVGLTEKEARIEGHRVLTATIPAAAMPRARTSGRTEGILKAVVDADTRRILGCTLLAEGAGEMIGTVQMAMLAGLPYTAVRDAVFSHPTMTEGLGALFATLHESSPAANHG
jgi:pyruvate/2-oxoglutarate dehydrogenase complex dihydrolipoamide dehydrogenase (E3) component